MIYVTNAFSLQMLPEWASSAKIQAVLFSTNAVKDLLRRTPWESAIGHSDLAAVASGELGIAIHVNRKSVTFDSGDQLLVIQYRGPRLPEGATKLPDGAEIQYWRVTHFND